MADPLPSKSNFWKTSNKLKLLKKLARLGKALLIMHAPQDLTVPVENAAQIYHVARHPKSFVSLDGADHLLSDKMDSVLCRRNDCQLGKALYRFP